jgi:hypothetical protein
MSRIPARTERSDLGLVAAALIGAGLVAASLLLLVFVRVGQTRAGYDVHDLRAERTRLAQERAALDVERASLLRPARLATWARTEAGLVPVDAARLMPALARVAPVATADARGEP